MVRFSSCLWLLVSLCALAMVVAPRELVYATRQATHAPINDASHPLDPSGATAQLASLPKLDLVGGTGSFIEAVAIHGSLAYAGEGRQLSILDVSVPAQPALLTRLFLDGEIRAIDVVGDRAFVANYERGFQVVDIHDVLHPQLVTTLPTPGKLTDIQVVGTLAYLSNYNYGLHIIDISDPDAPRLVGSPDPPLGSTEGVEVIGRYAYIASLSGLVILDIIDPTRPIQVGAFETASNGIGNAFGLDVHGSLVYLADGAGGLQIIDVSDPAHPRAIGSFDTPQVARDVQVEGGRAYIADREGGVQVVDVTNAAAPRGLGSFATGSMALRIQIVGDLAYVATYVNGLQILNILDPALPALVGGYGTSGNGWQVGTEDGFAYIAAGKEGLQIVDVHTPSRPFRYGSLAFPGTVYAVQVVDHIAYVGDNELGRLYLVDISHPDRPRIQSSVSTPQRAVGIHVVGTLVYVAAGGGGLQIVDVSDHDHPKLVGTIDPKLYVHDVDVVGDVAFIASEFGGFQTIDVSNPAHPTMLGAVPLTRTNELAEAVDVVGTLAYVGTTAVDPIQPWAYAGTTADVMRNATPSGLRIFDVSDPTHPLLRGSVDLPTGASDVQVVGDRAYVISKNKAVQIFDISDPAHPALIDSEEVVGASYGQFVDGLMYVVGYGAGLQILSTDPQFKTSQTIVRPDGGSASSSDGSVRLQFAAGTFASPVTVVQMGRLGATPPLNGDDNVVRSFSAEGRAANGQVIRQLQRPYMLEVNYTDDEVARLGISESNLNLATWNGSDWTELLPCASCSLDTATNRISAPLNQFATYALVRGSTQRAAPIAAFSDSIYRVNETAANAIVTVRLDTPAPRPVSVRYITSDGSATVGSDYGETSGTLTFEVGQTQAAFAVPLVNDRVREADETVLLTLSDPTGVTIGAPSTALLTIIDADSDPSDTTPRSFIYLPLVKR